MLGPNKPSKWWIVIVDIWKSYMYTAVKKRIKEILAAMNTTELVVEIRPGKKIQARTGFEFVTSAIPVQCSTSCVSSL